MASALFELLRRDLEEWIDWHRVPRFGPLDILATAERVGVSVAIEPIHASGDRVSSTSGLCGRDWILVNGLCESAEWPKIFGHEMAHYLIRSDLGLSLKRQQEENFCEWFGRELALPLAQVGRYSDLEAICKEMRVDAQVAHFQLWRAGLASSECIIDYGNCELPYCVHHNCYDPELFPEEQCECSVLSWELYPHTRPASYQMTLWDERLLAAAGTFGYAGLYPEVDKIGSLEELGAKSASLDDGIPF